MKRYAPTEKELNGSIRILQAMQFLQASGKFLSLTQTGTAFVAAATRDQITTLGSWHTLTANLLNIRRNEA